VINVASHVTLHLSTATFSNIFPPCQPRLLALFALRYQQSCCIGRRSLAYFLPSASTGVSGFSCAPSAQECHAKQKPSATRIKPEVSRDPINPKGLWLSPRLRRDQLLLRSRSGFTASSGFYHHSALTVYSKVSALHRQPIVNFPMNGLRQATQLECSWIALSPNICTHAARGRCEPITDLRNP
jgi:hypothetical protein